MDKTGDMGARTDLERKGGALEEVSKLDEGKVMVDGVVVEDIIYMLYIYQLNILIILGLTLVEFTHRQKINEIIKCANNTSTTHVCMVSVILRYSTFVFFFKSKKKTHSMLQFLGDHLSLPLSQPLVRLAMCPSLF